MYAGMYENYVRRTEWNYPREFQAPQNPTENRQARETLAAAVVRKTRNQGKTARQVYVTTELPTVMDFSWSQESEEEVI